MKKKKARRAWVNRNGKANEKKRKRKRENGAQREKKV